MGLNLLNSTSANNGKRDRRVHNGVMRKGRRIGDGTLKISEVFEGIFFGIASVLLFHAIKLLVQ
jgi:hypothetical protein